MTARDPDHWLYRYTPREWIRASLGEIRHARAAFGRHNGRAGLAGCRRAAGVAINGMLATQPEPDPTYGRTYMDHLAALATDGSAPDAVRVAARTLVATPLPGGPVVALRTASTDERMLDAAETVMAHAYALVLRAEPSEDAEGGEEGGGNQGEPTEP